jgi:large subunit ribosomal protein L4
VLEIVHLVEEKQSPIITTTMASKQIILPLRSRSIHPVCRVASRNHVRSMATQAAVPPTSPTSQTQSQPQRQAGSTMSSSIPAHLAPTPALATLWNFPTLEPLRFIEYPANHLNLPLRKDLLHRAVIYEGDKTRQGTASTKWRSEVHGSNRKIRPQKGSGRARLGNKKSPMLRGGGVAFGPKPRDFSTGLPKKVYDLAFRTALSYRWRRGELVVVNDLEIPKNIDESDNKYWVKHCFNTLRWGNGHGRSFLVMKETENEKRLAKTLNEECGEHGRARLANDVDVKNLLEMGRLVIEQGALKELFQWYRSDLPRPTRKVVGLGSGLTKVAAPGEVEELIEDMEDMEEEEFDEDQGPHLDDSLPSDFRSAGSLNSDR